MKSVVVIRNAICTWNWSESASAAASRARRHRITWCSTTSAMRPRPAPAMATPIRISRMGSSSSPSSRIHSSSRISRIRRTHSSGHPGISTISISRRRMWRPHRAAPPRGCSWSTRCTCVIRWPRAWTPSPIACIRSRLCSPRAWRIWVSCPGHSVTSLEGFDLVLVLVFGFRFA